MPMKMDPAKTPATVLSIGCTATVKCTVTGVFRRMLAFNRSNRRLLNSIGRTSLKSTVQCITAHGLLFGISSMEFDRQAFLSMNFFIFSKKKKRNSIFISWREKCAFSTEKMHRLSTDRDRSHDSDVILRFLKESSIFQKFQTGSESSTFISWKITEDDSIRIFRFEKKHKPLHSHAVNRLVRSKRVSERSLLRTIAIKKTHFKSTNSNCGRTMLTIEQYDLPVYPKCESRVRWFRSKHRIF